MKLIIIFILIFQNLVFLQANRRRRLLRVGVRPDPPLKPSTKSSKIYLSYTSFLRGFVSSQGIFNQNAPIPSADKYAAFMDTIVSEGSIRDKNELSAFMAHALVASRGLTIDRENNLNIIDELTRSYYRRGYLGVVGVEKYRQASLDIYEDLRLLQVPELVTQDSEINWRVSLWNWERFVLGKFSDFASVTDELLGPKTCETVYRVYSILKREWDPKSKHFHGCIKLEDLQKSTQILKDNTNEQ